MARSRNEMQRNTGSNGNKAKTHGRGAGPVPLEKLAEKTRKLPAKQREAIEGLELGVRYAGRTFKRAGSQLDSPTVRRRASEPRETD